MNTTRPRCPSAAQTAGVMMLGTTLLFTALTRPATAEIPPDSPAREALERAEAAVGAIVARPTDQRTFENTVLAIDDLVTRLSTDTNMVRFLPYVSTDAAERAAGELAEQHVTNWLIDLGKREDLYQAVRAVAAKGPPAGGEHRRLLDFTLRDYRRAGMELSAEQRAELTRIEKEITRLGIEFERNIRTDETRLPLTAAELSGLPADLLAGLPHAGEMYLVGLDAPTFTAVQESCDVEATRAKLWIAYKRRAGQKNVDLLEQIIALRAQAARLLGYATPADYEIEPRMAAQSSRVREFYEKLRPLVRRKAQQDLAEYVAAKRAHTGRADAVLYPWDTPYYKKRLMKEKYAVDYEKVQEYFPLERVIEGLFAVTQNLYGLEYRDVTAQAASRSRPLWHPEVRLYEVVDKASGQMIGEFYLDLFPRDNKYTHFAQWGLVSRKRWPDGSVQKPLAALVCNFSKPTPDKPSLLPHEEVETFFHEFGHCLHTLLTEAETGRFAGTAVALDFVEAPSQMFENWVWDATVLKTFARHYQTGEPFPDELLSGMLAARYQGSGMDAERQFYYGLVDLTYHSQPDGQVATTSVANALFPQVEQYPAIEGVYFQAAFGHLVGYQAGYYSYMWSQVFAQDMFKRFKELGLLNPEAGRYYRQKVLSRGGSREELESLKDYLGREPQMDAFLEHLGLKAN